MRCGTCRSKNRSGMLGEPRSLERGEILAGVMRRAGQRTGRDEQEALGLGDGGVGGKLVGRHEADHRMRLAGRLQVLADGEEIDVRRAEVVHELQYLV